MNYTFQVAYLNTIRNKKIIPKNILQEIETNKNLSSLISALKEYKYNKIFPLSNPELEIQNATNFESVLYAELKETIDFINTLLYEKHKWLTQIMEYFCTSLDFKDINSVVLFFENQYNLSKKLNSSFCEKFIKTIIDFENIKIFLSFLKIEKTPTEFISNGNIQKSKFNELFPSVEELNKYLQLTFYPKIKIEPDLQNENLYFKFNYYLEELISQSKFFYFTIEPIIFYFFEKLIETQKLKKIYYEIKN
jgi:vacuolar-type H+-ATPase subunit C/Vma6